MVMFILAVVLLLLMGAFININRNSLHFFYRDRLSGTSLIRRVNEKIRPNHLCY